LIALLAASLVSTLGSMMSLVAIPWLVLVTTGSPADMGLVVAAGTVPYLTSSVFGTPLADRLGMRVTAIVADTVSAVATAVIAISPDVGLPAIAAMVGVSGLVRGVGDRTKHVLLRPAGQAAGTHIARVTSIYDGLSNAATLAGAPLGGLIVFWFGAQAAVLVDAASFAISALLVAVLTRPALEPPAPTGTERYLPALAAGARRLGRDRLLLLMIGTVFFANIVNQAIGSVFVPLWVSDVLHSPAALGIVFGAVSAGAILGNLVFTALAVKLSRYVVFAAGMAISGAPRVLVLGLSDQLTVVLTVSFLCGVAASAVNPILGAQLYERVPDEFQTRVFGLVAAIAYAGFPIGGVLGGAAVAGIGLRPAILLAGGLYLVATLAPLLGYRAARTRCAPNRGAPAGKT